MEPFSVAAAAITLCPLIITTGRELRKVAQTVRYARREIKKLTTELVIFGGELDNFSEALRAGENDMAITVPIKALFKFSKRTQKDAEGLLRKVRVLAARPQSEPSLTEVASAYMMWYFSTSAVNCIRAMLSVARESINGLTNIQYIKQMDKELQMLRAILSRGSRAEREEVEQKLKMTIEERQEMLRDKMRIQRVVRHELDKRIQVANDKVVQLGDKVKNESFKPNTDSLFKLTGAVKSYAENHLPMKRSGRRSRILHPIDVDPLYNIGSRSRSKSRSSPSSWSPTQPTQSTSASMSTASSTPDASARNLTTTDPSSEDLSSPKEPVKPNKLSSTSKPDVGILDHCSMCGGIRLHTEEHHTSVSGQSPEAIKGPVDDLDGTRAENDATKVQVHPRPQKTKSESATNHEGTTLRTTRMSKGRSRSPKLQAEVNSASEYDYDDNQPYNDESEEEEAEEEEEEEWKEGQSTFRPLFGIKGKQPRGWQTRHTRSDSS